MRVRKLPRVMDAWVYDRSSVPSGVWEWVHALPGGLVAVTSPRHPHHTVVMPSADCVVIRSEVGCLYAVSKRDFAAKYERLETELL